MPRRFPGRLLAAVALIPTLAVLAGAQGFMRTDVSNTPDHLVLNLIPKTDGNEVDFWVCDIDNDGDNDVIAARKTPFTSSVNGLQNILLLNDGAGHLTDETVNYTQWASHFDLSRDVHCSDMNNDGWPDVVFFNTENQDTKLYFNLGNDAQGNWLGLGAPTMISFGPQFNFCGGATLDYDLDGKNDIYRVDYTSSANPSTHGDDLLRQDPNNAGSFLDVTGSIPNIAPGFTFGGIQMNGTQANFGTQVQVQDPADGGILDINGDGLVDILVTGREKMRVAYTDGLGGFLATQDLTPNANDVYASVAGDFDGDGRVDFFKVRDGSDVYTLNLSTNPNGTINESGQSAPGFTTGFGANAQAVDFDGDGDLDVFVAPTDPDIPNCGQGRKLELFENTGASGAGRFALWTTNGSNSGNPLPLDVYDAAIADFDGDGILDILMASCGPQSGWRYWVSDPNAQSNEFRSEFQLVPATGDKDFKVVNIPTNAGGFRTLYNLFDTDTSIPLGSGPFLGLSNEVVPQIGAGEPFRVVLGPNTDNWDFTIPANIVSLVPTIRTRSVLVDFGVGSIDVTDLIEEN